MVSQFSCTRKLRAFLLNDVIFNWFVRYCLKFRENDNLPFELYSKIVVTQTNSARCGTARTGGGDSTNPRFDSSENWYRIIYMQICYHYFFSFLRVLGPKKASKFSKTKIFIFEYFTKIPSEMNSNDPFYPILIPNTPYVKFSSFWL